MSKFILKNEILSLLFLFNGDLHLELKNFEETTREIPYYF